MPNISFFGSIYEISSKENVPIEAYLQEVKDGRWEDEIYKIRNQKTEEAKEKLKKALKRVTFSGIFSKRENTGLLEHSGYIAIDLDDLEDPEVIKDLLRDEKYIYAAFVSSGGKGLTLLFKIQPAKHRESFLGISEYLYSNYNLVCDPQSISVCKPFGVTFDPNIYICDRNVPIFTLYPQERKEKKITNFAFASDDFENLIKQIEARKINLCEDYFQWLKIGFAFADKFGESGRYYYHIVSSISDKYHAIRTDKQYNYCLRSKNLKLATIATFYFYCKEVGLPIFSERTSKVRKTTLTSKAAGLSKQQIVENLKKFEHIEGVEQLVSDVYEGTNEVGDEDSIIDQLELYFTTNYSLERNVITRYIESSGKPLEQSDLNSMFIAAKRHMKQLSYELVERLLFSDFVKRYNPVIRYLESFPEKNVKGKNGEFLSPVIDSLSASIKNDVPQYTQYFFRKWIVSSMSSIHGVHSPLLFVLSGQVQGTGKTEFFRRLLPKEMQKYYAESKLDAGKDDEILMTQKWFIMDDEMSGKSKREEQRLKELTSAQWFSLREPYGRVNVDLMRIATLCATTNSTGILRDYENRRIIPIPVYFVDTVKYNSVDKAELLREAYWLYKSGFDWQVTSKDDMTYLRSTEHDFEFLTIEKELILKYYSNVSADTAMSGTEIKVELEKMTNQKLSLDALGKHLGKLGFEKKSIRKSGQSMKCWIVKKVNRSLPEFGNNGNGAAHDAPDKWEPMNNEDENYF